jgi:homoserine kinase
MKYYLKAPATTANVGSGFDVFGIAIGYFNEFYFERNHSSDKIDVVAEGVYSGHFDPYSLVKKSFEYFFKQTGVRKIGVNIIEKCNIPHKRGLGSSASAIAASLKIADFLSQSDLPLNELLKMGTELEGHPDNIIPCLLGGLVVSYYDDKKVDFEKFNIENFELSFIVPEIEMQTEKMRKSLPKEVNFDDAVFNMKNGLQFLSKISKHKYDEAFKYTSDRLHQKYRIETSEEMRKLINKVENDERIDFWFLSGSGSIICFKSKKQLNFEETHIITKKIYNKPIKILSIDDKEK